MVFWRKESVTTINSQFSFLSSWDRNPENADALVTTVYIRIKRSDLFRPTKILLLFLHPPPPPPSPSIKHVLNSLYTKDQMAGLLSLHTAYQDLWIKLHRDHWNDVNSLSTTYLWFGALAYGRSKDPRLQAVSYLMMGLGLFLSLYPLQTLTLRYELPIQNTFFTLMTLTFTHFFYHTEPQEWYFHTFVILWFTQKPWCIYAHSLFMLTLIYYKIQQDKSVRFNQFFLFASTMTLVGGILVRVFPWLHKDVPEFSGLQHLMWAVSVYSLWSVAHNTRPRNTDK